MGANVMRKTGGLLGLVTLLIACGSEDADREWPQGSIRVYVGWAAGGAADIIARSLVREMEAPLGQRIIVTNVTGALGSIAGAQVAMAPPDGNVWFGGALVAGTWPVLGFGDTTWTHFYSFPAVIFGTTVYVREDAPWQNLEELMSAIRSEPAGRFRYGHPGRGSNGEIFAAAILEEAGVGDKVEAVPYEGGREAGRFLLGGDLDFVSVTLGDLSDWAVAGRVRPLANLYEKDLDFEGVIFPSVTRTYPDLAGIQPINPYFGIAVHRGTPARIVTKISEAFAHAVRQERFRRVAVLERAGLLAPEVGRPSDEILSKIESARGWALFELGVAARSPAEFGIPRLKEWSWPPHDRARQLAPWPEVAAQSQ